MFAIFCKSFWGDGIEVFLKSSIFFLSTWQAYRTNVVNMLLFESWSPLATTPKYYEIPLGRNGEVFPYRGPSILIGGGEGEV